MAQAPNAFQNRTIRKFPISSALESAGAEFGAYVGLTSGELVAVASPVATGEILGFLLEPTSPEDQPSFSQGGGDGGAFTVDVHPGEALVAVAEPDATFILDLYDDVAAGTPEQQEPVTADIGASYGLGLVDGVAVVDQNTSGDCTVVSIVERVQQSAGEPSGFSRVEVRIDAAAAVLY